jgi:Domain of unknown function (DUF4365)
MTTFGSYEGLLGRRAELMAELFLRDLEPSSLWRPGQIDNGVDYFITFVNRRGGTNSFAIEVKATEREVKSTFPVDEKTVRSMLLSNMPSLLLVVDAKMNKLYFAWIDKELTNSPSKAGKIDLKVKAVTDTQKRKLRERMTSLDPWYEKGN